MSLPIGFLLGLLVIVGHRELGNVLPGEASASGVAFAMLALALPLALALAAHRATRTALVRARRPAVPPRALLRLSLLATPLALHVLFAHGAYGDWVDRLAPTSHLLRVALAVLPLYAAELPRLMVATATEALVEDDRGAGAQLPVPAAMLPRWRDIWPVVRLRFGWPLLALLPLAVLGAGMDALQFDRAVYVFVLATSVGLTLATLGFLLAVSLLLPFWFRFAFGARSMPGALGEQLRRTSGALGFHGRRVLALPTGMRAINAMMVGPLPFGRLLCLTDGLMATLDPRALAGVIAHEVGHARRGHPGILMSLAVLMPMLLLVPLHMVDFDNVDPVLQSAILLAVLLLVWFAVRSIARRFEHEADVTSVRLLGAEPCSRALMMVARLTVPNARRLVGPLMSLHPDEAARLSVMRRYEQDEQFRHDFDVRGRNLRRGLIAALCVALMVAAWSWRADWPYERALTSFHTGDYVGARQLVADLERVPERWRETLQRVDREAACALELAPRTRTWQQARRRLDPVAWQRGQQVLLAEGPAAARPWLSVAVAVMRTPSPTQLAIYEYCRAADEHDPETMARLTAIIRRLGVPRELDAVF